MARSFVVPFVLALTMLLCRAASADVPLKGNVLLPDGKPAAKATVRLLYVHGNGGHGSSWLADTQAGEGGTFEIALPDYTPPAVKFNTAPMQVYLVAEAAGCAPCAVPVVPGAHEGITLKLAKSMPVTCRVVDAGGRPAKDVTVQLACLRPMSPGGNWGAIRAQLEVDALLLNARTDARGVAVVKNAPASPSPFLAMVYDRSLGAGREMGQPGAPVTVKLSGPPVVVKGKVTLADTGKPAAGMLVFSLIDSNNPMSMMTPNWTLTNERGEYELPFYLDARMSSPPWTRMLGEQVLVVVDPSPSPAYAPVWPTKRGREFSAKAPVNLQMRRGKQVKGHVMNSLTNQPVPHSTVQITQDVPSGGSFTFYRTTDAKGAYSLQFAGKQPNLYAEYVPPGFSRVDSARSVPPSRDLKNYLVWIGLVAQSGTEVAVTTPEGQPAGGVLVVAVQPDVYRFPGATTDAGGRARINKLAQARPVRFYALDEKNGTAGFVDVSAEALKAGKPIALKLAKGATLEVKVVDTNGASLPAIVSVFARTRTGHIIKQIAYVEERKFPKSGVVKINGLVPGIRYTVSAFKQRYRLVAAGHEVAFQIAPGQTKREMTLKLAHE